MKMRMSKKYCHAELVSASALYIVQRFRNKFGMMLYNELMRQPRHVFSVNIISIKGVKNGIQKNF